MSLTCFSSYTACSCRGQIYWILPFGELIFTLILFDYLLCLSLFVFNVNWRLLMFICIWIWYFMLYWVGDSPGWFAFASLCFSTFDFAHVTLYYASFTLNNHMLESCHALPLSLKEAWLRWRQALVRQSTATIVCRRATHARIVLLSPLHQGNIM